MNKLRIEAFSDGVFAIIITIMVLEIHVPQAYSLAAFRSLGAALAAYVLSFLFVGGYWVNHHHTFQACDHIEGRTLWMNLHLLFWLSLFPFCTEWLVESHFGTIPVAFYGFILLAASYAGISQMRALAACHGPESYLAKALGSDKKGRFSMVAYAVAIPLAFLNSWAAYGVYILVALFWMVPDRRIEKVLPVRGGVETEK